MNDNLKKEFQDWYINTSGQQYMPWSLIWEWLEQKALQSPSAGEGIKYFLEDKREQYGKWLRLSGPWVHQYGKGVMEGGEETKWTNDPHQAIQWNTRKEAEEFLEKHYKGIGGFEITEHEFVASAGEDAVQFAEKFYPGKTKKAGSHGVLVREKRAAFVEGWNAKTDATEFADFICNNEWSGHRKLKPEQTTYWANDSVSGTFTTQQLYNLFREQAGKPTIDSLRVQQNADYKKLKEENERLRALLENADKSLKKMQQEVVRLREDNEDDIVDSDYHQ